MRTTSILDWVIVLIGDIFSQKRTSFIKIVLVNLAHGLIAICLAILFESLFYGELLYTGWNFLKFNVLSDGSSHFGVNSSFSYIFLFMPTQMIFFFPMLVFGIWLYCKR